VGRHSSSSGFWHPLWAVAGMLLSSYRSHFEVVTSAVGASLWFSVQAHPRTRGLRQYNSAARMLVQIFGICFTGRRNWNSGSGCSFENLLDLTDKEGS